MSSSKKALVAMGADSKNRFLVSHNNSLRFGPELGAIETVENYQKLKKALFELTSRISPRIVACDMHPGYFSSRLGREYCRQFKDAGNIFVQHHHAHLASVMCEHKLTAKAIGVCFDGTGYGLDGNMWGGEFFIFNRRNFNRVAHFKYLAMPGRDKVVHEPWRMVLSVLGDKGLPLLKQVKEEEKRIVLNMIEKEVNTSFTSSVGRLFDASAALLGICAYAEYEAQGPVELEKLCRDDVDDYYHFEITPNQGGYLIDVSAMFLQMREDTRRLSSRNIAPTKVHNTFVEIIERVVGRISRESGIKEVVLSGGVFQNKFLAKKAASGLRSAGYGVYLNEKLPSNDYNIALGQYYVSCSTRKN